jgi:archaellum component FlaC
MEKTMKTNRLTILTLCLVVGLGGLADQAMAKKKNKNKAAYSEQYDYDHPSGKGYPNGRPWQAMEYDFEVVKHKLDVLDYKVDGVKDDTESILDSLGDLESEIGDIAGDIGEIAEDVDDIEGDVEMLKNTLSVDVSVGPATDTGITLYVQVAQNGMGMTKLAADAFSYGNAFPSADAAKYCGAGCFAEGSGGVYMIDLLVDAVSGSYAGALAVSMEVPEDDDMDDGDDPEIANGTALVSFEVDAVVEPL